MSDVKRRKVAHAAPKRNAEASGSPTFVVPANNTVDTSAEESSVTLDVPAQDAPEKPKTFKELVRRLLH